VSTPEVADFNLADRLGSGPAEVYLASAPPRLAPRGAVAVHVLRPLHAASFERLRPTLDALAALRSPYLAPVVEIGCLVEADPACAWYVTEDSGRADLTVHHPAGEVLRILSGAARGVHALHEAGLTHGTVSPATVHPGPEGGRIDLPEVTREWAVEGWTLSITDTTLLDTVDPALLRGMPPSRSSDVWALGATLYRAVSGKLMHPALGGDEAIIAIQRAAFETVHLDDVGDPDLAATVASCVAPDPADRPPSAAALADHLDALGARR